ncbi:MAG: DUF2946 domain-containing protein [Hyphomicrobiales bacterium]|nr:MAG: DUF2946 domain-containing protein [Hyphomicrobiales bacterium]
MQFLRSSSLLARLILAWFVMTMGIAIASPIVHPEAMELVCSASGNMKLIAIGDDGIEQSHHTLDCPMCMGITLPPHIASARFVQPQPLAHALHKFSVAHIASVAGAPLPPRGPPAAL